MTGFVVGFLLGGALLYITRGILPFIDPEAPVFPMESEDKLDTSIAVLGRAMAIWPRLTLHTLGVVRFLYRGFVLNFTDPKAWEKMDEPKVALTLVSRKPIERAAALVAAYQARGIEARIVDGAEVDFDSRKLVFVAVGAGHLKAGNFAYVIRRHVLYLALTRGPKPKPFRKKDRMVYAG